MAILARRGNAAEPASLLGKIKLINSLEDKGVNELAVNQTEKAGKTVNSLERKPVNVLPDSNRERISELVHKWELKAAETSSSSPRWYFARKMLAELQQVLAEGNRRLYSNGEILVVQKNLRTETLIPKSSDYDF